MLTTVQAWVDRAAHPFSRVSADARAHERLRFYALLGLALLKLFNLFGSIWDIQWHASIGRDSNFIPPHIVAAGGFVGALGLALAVICYETYLDRRGVRLPGVKRFGGITVAPAFMAAALFLLAVPDSNQNVAMIHHIVADGFISFMAGWRWGQTMHILGPFEQALEFGFRFLGLEVKQIGIDRKGERNDKPAVRAVENGFRDETVCAFGER